MGILTWIVVGLFAGLVARAIVPGKQPMGWVATTLLGMVGSVVGGIAGSVAWHRSAAEFTPGGLFLSVVGAVLVLFAFGQFRRPIRA